MFFNLLSSIILTLPVANLEFGDSYSFEEHSKKVHVIELYFNSCPACNDNAPNVHEYFKEVEGHSGIQVLDVGIDSKDSDYRSWLSKHGSLFPVLKDSGRKLAKLTNTRLYPTTVVLDCQGEFTFKSVGVWTEATKKSLNEAVQSALSKCQETP